MIGGFDPSVFDLSVRSTDVDFLNPNSSILATANSLATNPSFINGLSARFSFTQGGDFGVTEVQVNASVSDLTVISTGSPVPVPAAAWLFSSALVGLAGLRRR